MCSSDLPELGYIYDKNKSEHYHFYDVETKKIYDLDIAYQEQLDRLVEKMIGGKIKSHSIIFEGKIEKKKTRNDTLIKDLMTDIKGTINNI